MMTHFSLRRRPCLCIAAVFLMLLSTHLVSAQRLIISLETDRARYSPGDTVSISMELQSIPDGLEIAVRYFWCGRVIEESTAPLSGAASLSWQWLPPALDFRGYLLDVSLRRDGLVIDRGSVGIDVSSGWSRFPRYGFLTHFPFMSGGEMETVIRRLNRFHINGLQFYDWQYKHHLPLKGTPQNPAPTWNDIANRTVYFSTVKGYIDAAHRRGMKAMSYNLLYGAYANAHEDGVDPSWSLYRDASHQNRDYHPLPASWASNIYVMDPTNPLWKAYILERERQSFEALPFDGWHIDQLGDRGTLYNQQGQQVPLQNAFGPFIAGAKESLNVDLVFNAVNQFGQQGVALSPVDFLYTEVWDPNTSFGHLVTIINRNASYSSNRLNTVLAAYMNYALADSPGWFNTPGVLMTDAVIFAAGGSHLELGEHMLAKEYFPNNNLKMSAELDEKLLHYYDFLTAYENLLRDSLSLSPLSLNTSGPAQLSSVLQANTVWYFVKRRGDREVIQLLNFNGAGTLEWRDNQGSRKEPVVQHGVPISFNSGQTVASIWLASPDTLGGVPIPLLFQQAGDAVSFTLPVLRYWDMVVVEYDETTSAVDQDPAAPVSSVPLSLCLAQNYPNPFNPTTTIGFSLPERSRVTLAVFNTLGQQVALLANGEVGAGHHQVQFTAAGLPSGTYFYRMLADGFVRVRRLVFLK